MVTVRTTSSGPRTAENLLDAGGLPTFFAINQLDTLDPARPDHDVGQSVRVWARSLAGMQKEAIVRSSRPGCLWRLASDEGPYLDGFDAAPCPLAFMTVGMVSSYMNALRAAARRRALDIRDLTLTQDNRYTMEGSALQGTMTGGALPVALEVQIDTDADDDAVSNLVTEAVGATPVNGLQRERHISQFTLTVNGEPLSLDRAAPLPHPTEPDPDRLFSGVGLAASPDGGQVRRLEAVTPVANVAGGVGSSLRAEQRRQLHVRAICNQRADGVKEIEQQLHRPLGSTFQFLSDEGQPGAGSSPAPDAASYMAAGVAFCFMTQLGRFATIMKHELPGYRVVQDTHFRPGAEDRPGTAGPVATHVFLDTPDGADFARHCLDMAEQTCFLHALYRTPLEPIVTITRV
ncbi:MAG TPA: OsmC family peroxiredoxin [Acidobacteria bacterium]|nr:OsmC family peroxiredoxin [Acidobacteriota bacterium]